MTGSYKASLLPLKHGIIDQAVFFEELIDATAKLEVYKEKIRDSKLDSSWFMPTLQQKEALASSAIEGTQATLDGVLINQLSPNDNNQEVNKVVNYYLATVRGYDLLRYHDFSHEFFQTMHQALMHGNVEKPEIVGAYRVSQNYIGKKVRMEGLFSMVEGEGRNYFTCIITDATACCSQGVEFSLKGDYNYPEDYPELGDPITVAGVFETYKEGSNKYCQLKDAEFE